MTYAENVVAVYNRATDAEHEAGLSWYDDARALALDLSPNDVWRGAGVIACYSPVTPWKRNVELAIDSLNSGIARSDFLPAMVVCAQRILDGEFALDVLNGDKTRAFASAIADPHSQIATIDRHAHDIAMGRVFTDKERKIGKRLFRTMSAHYREAAFELNIESVSQLQAITWVVWRREKGIK